jgi:hypothetical protein
MGISSFDTENEKLQGNPAKCNRGNLTDLFLGNRSQIKLTDRTAAGILTLL